MKILRKLFSQYPPKQKHFLLSFVLNSSPELQLVKESFVEQTQNWGLSPIVLSLSSDDAKKYSFIFASENEKEPYDFLQNSEAAKKEIIQEFQIIELMLSEPKEYGELTNIQSYLE